MVNGMWAHTSPPPILSHPMEQRCHIHPQGCAQVILQEVYLVQETLGILPHRQGHSAVGSSPGGAGIGLGLLEGFADQKLYRPPRVVRQFICVAHSLQPSLSSYPAQFVSSSLMRM